MVKSKVRYSAGLGSILLKGAFSSIGLWFFSVFILVVSGKKVYPWPFSINRFFNGGSILEFGAELGVLLLAATPVTMLIMFIIYSIGQKDKRAIFIGLSVMSVVFVGLFMAMTAG